MRVFVCCHLILPCSTLPALPAAASQTWYLIMEGVTTASIGEVGQVEALDKYGVVVGGRSNTAVVRRRGIVLEGAEGLEKSVYVVYLTLLWEGTGISLVHTSLGRYWDKSRTHFSGRVG